MASPNPAGRGAAKLAAAPGTDGVQSIGGYIIYGEKDQRLIPPSKWVTYDNLLAIFPIVAAVVRVWLDLGGSVKYSLQENKRGGAQAKAALELVQEGLIDARMPQPFSEVLRTQAMAEFRGVALHAKGTRRDRLGRLVFSELAHRPAWTVEKWEKPDEGKPWTAITQRGRTGKLFRIERGDLFYSVDRAFGTDTPDGVGRFRSIVETERIWSVFRRLLGIAFETDVNGVPLVRVPLSQLADEAVKVGGVDAEDASAISAYVQARIQPIVDFAKKRVTTPDRHVAMDSATYLAKAVDGSEVPSDVYLWDIDTIKTVLGSIPELRKELGDLEREAARVMVAEWMLMGNSEGARSVHGDKTDMMGLAINAHNDRLTADAQRDLVDWIVAANGYDVETCAPKLVHEPVATVSSLEAAQTLEALLKGGIDKASPIYKRFCERLDLPTDGLEDMSKPVAPAKQKPTEDPPPPGEDA